MLEVGRRLNPEVTYHQRDMRTLELRPLKERGKKRTALSYRGPAWGTMEYAAEEPAWVELDSEVESGE